ncbi:hypothetical protein EC988_008637 [Linderina pennispora]|nr:hypothetical protein EC988_008637 [Linderina pennispora]
MLRRAGPSERSMFPGIILIFTGCAMGAHEQDTEFSTKVHFVFGLSLVLAGLMRCIEIMLITTGLIKTDSKEPNPFQYIPVFFLCHSGVMFMSANRENVAAMINIGIDIGTFSLGFLSITFLLFFYSYFLMQLFSELGSHDSGSLPVTDDGIAYHTVGQVAEIRNGNYSSEETSRDVHVLFDAGDEEEDAFGIRTRRDARSSTSDEIEMSPIQKSE